MTWSNSTPYFGAACRFAMQPICSQREAAPGVVPGAAKTEPPTEGAGSSSGVPRARHRQALTDPSRSVVNRSRNFLLRGGKVLPVPAQAQKKTARRRLLCGDLQIEKAAGSPCGLRVKIECV
jgi:hypothetical protein